MSLDFSVAKIEDYANRTTAPHLGYGGKEQWHPVTNVLVWSSIPCGFYCITTKNVDEVWHRLSMWQAVQGALLHGPDGDIYLTREDVVMHIGLSTNASSKTRSEFNKTLERALEQKVKDTTGRVMGAMHRIGWKGQAPATVEPAA